MFEKNKEKMKEKMEPDKVLRFAIVAVILLFLIGALIIGTRMMNPRVDATEGVKKLTELEDANVQKIDAKHNAAIHFFFCRLCFPRCRLICFCLL